MAHSAPNSRPTLTIIHESGLEGPTADFSYTTNHPQQREEVSFEDDSTGEPTRRLWDFGDDHTSQEQNPARTYTTSGTKSRDTRGEQRCW